MIIQLIDEAVANGARREKASAVLGLSDRAIARWRAEAGGDIEQMNEYDESLAGGSQDVPAVPGVSAAITWRVPEQ